MYVATNIDRRSFVPSTRILDGTGQKQRGYLTCSYVLYRYIRCVPRGPRPHLRIRCQFVLFNTVPCDAGGNTRIVSSSLKTKESLNFRLKSYLVRWYQVPGTEYDCTRYVILLLLIRFDPKMLGFQYIVKNWARLCNLAPSSTLRTFKTKTPRRKDTIIQNHSSKFRARYLQPPNLLCNNKY